MSNRVARSIRCIAIVLVMAAIAALVVRLLLAAAVAVGLRDMEREFTFGRGQVESDLYRGRDGNNADRDDPEEVERR